MKHSGTLYASLLSFINEHKSEFCIIKYKKSFNSFETCTLRDSFITFKRTADENALCVLMFSILLNNSFLHVIIFSLLYRQCQDIAAIAVS
jgi:hypothetical protein